VDCRWGAHWQVTALALTHVLLQLHSWWYTTAVYATQAVNFFSPDVLTITHTCLLACWLVWRCAVQLQQLCPS
jgi:hypothetical protein